MYNCSSCGLKGCTNREIVNLGYKFSGEIPLEGMLWRPGGFMTQNQTIYYIAMLILHLLPAVFIDGILKLVGRKPM